MSKHEVKNQGKMIGIVGGIGPYAGIDLFKKILDQTRASCDQDHLPISMLSVPHAIPDRTEFLLGKSDDNPAHIIIELISSLYEQGSEVMGMPCNTVHAAPIFNEIMNGIPKEIKLVHMICEVAAYIKNRYPPVVNVGILSTTGTHTSNVYPECLTEHGLVGIQVTDKIQDNYIHPAIYSPVHGIKAWSNPVKEQAKKDLLRGVEYLIGKGVEVIILGCTEIPLALTGNEIDGIPLIDATRVLARALIRESSPTSLLDQDR